MDFSELSRTAWLGFSLAWLGLPLLAVILLLRKGRANDWPAWGRRLVLSVAAIPVGLWLVYNADYFGWAEWRVAFAVGGRAILFVGGLLWLIWLVERKSREFQLLHRTAEGGLGRVGPLEAMSQSVGAPSTLAGRAWVLAFGVAVLLMISLGVYAMRDN